MANQYHVTVRQVPGTIVEVQIRTEPDELSGFLAAKKGRDFETLKLAPANVIANVNLTSRGQRFIEYSPDEAADVADWWRLAAKTAELLDVHIQTNEDLHRTVTAKVVGKSVVLEVGNG